MDTFNFIKEYADRIINDRDVYTIFDHAVEEQNELDLELERKYWKDAPGDDGVIGEAIDVIACMFDLIMKENPQFTSENFHEFLDKKLKKWERKYNTKN